MHCATNIVVTRYFIMVYFLTEHSGHSRFTKREFITAKIRYKGLGSYRK